MVYWHPFCSARVAFSLDPTVPMRIRAADQVFNGGTFQHRAGGGHLIDRIRQLYQTVGREDSRLCVGARVAGTEVRHPVARNDVLNPLAHDLDDAGGLNTRRKGKRNWIEALALVDINEVEADGFE
jgi:hypothetical protein